MSRKRNNRRPRKCTSEAQKFMIKKNYAIRSKKKKAQQTTTQKSMPTKYPFWARIKLSKHRTTLVIDDAPAYDKQKGEMVPGYVHREATHTPSKNTEEINPNPDRDDPKPMQLKRPKKHPQRLFEPHNKDLDMPQELVERYDKNNHKEENSASDEGGGDGEK